MKWAKRSNSSLERGLGFVQKIVDKVVVFSSEFWMGQCSAKVATLNPS